MNDLNSTHPAMIFNKIILSFLVLLMMMVHSCTGQRSFPVVGRHIVSDTEKADTAEALGDSLWYVFQDRHNNYWFGSNGEGVFLS